MKTRFFIILGMLLISTISILFSYVDETQIFSDKHDNEPYKPSLEQLQMILDYCNDTSEFKNAIGIEYFNDTHYINNNLCEWQKLTQFPNFTEYCIPGQNMWENVEEIRNNTHIYSKDKCLWEEEFNWEKEWGDKFQESNVTKLDDVYRLYPGVGWIHQDNIGNQKSIYKTHPDDPFELILDLDAMLQYQKVLDWCNRESLGLGVLDIGLSFNNGTHVIDNNNCEWEMIVNEN